MIAVCIIGFVVAAALPLVLIDRRRWARTLDSPPIRGEKT